MSVHIMATEPDGGPTTAQPPEASAGDDTESVTRTRSYVGYGGRYRQTRAGEVAHEVQWSSVPQWLGTTQIRRMELTADQLVLSAPTVRSPGGERTPRLVWRRIPANAIAPAVDRC